MKDIFGIPVETVTVVLVAGLLLALMYLGWIAWRKPLIFKMGLRNIPRRKAQSLLIVTGLMLSTLIIAASLGTGATLSHSLTSDIYGNLGSVDELIVSSPSFEAPPLERSATFSEGVIPIVDDVVAGSADLQAAMPYLESRFSVRNLATDLSEPDVVAIGIDPARLEAMGGLNTEIGTNIDPSILSDGNVVLSAEAADVLGASAGDVVRLSVEGTTHDLVVAAIAENTYLSGYRRGREDYLVSPGMALNLNSLQTMTNQPGQLSGIAISNTGGDRDGYTRTKLVMAAFEVPLAGTGLGIDTIKKASVADGERISKAFTSIFLILGMFAVVAGLLLIVLIFNMLAAERKTEMGISRAIGTSRAQLTQQFIAEGAGYGVVAGLVGAVLGSGAAMAIAFAMRSLFGDYATIEPYFDPRSMLDAFCLGLLMTFITIVLSSRRISRMNVVAAIRDIPESASKSANRRVIAGGIVVSLIGLMMAIAGHGNETASLLFSGLSLTVFGVALVAGYLGAPSRIVFSVTGMLVLVIWLMPENMGDRLWGELDHGTEVFFLAGIFGIIGATMVIVQNLDLLFSGLSRIGGMFRSFQPAIRTAVAYPAAAKGRTGLTIAMFSLIIFSVVLMATMSENYNALYAKDGANAGWDVRADLAGPPLNDDISNVFQVAGLSPDTVKAIAMTTRPNRESSQVRLQGAEDWKRWPVIGVDMAFLDESELKFSQRAIGYESDDAVLDAMRNDPGLAIIDSQAIPQDDLGADDAALALSNLDAGSDGFEPASIEVPNADGTISTVRVIAVIDDEISSLYGLFVSQQVVDAMTAEPAMTSYLVALQDSASAKTVAASLEATLVDDGVQAVSIEQELADAQAEESGFLKLVEGFMALGLIVGIAAIGVVAFRSVVERRQQIGMLRAIGFRSNLISASFGIETLVVVGMGILAGSTLGGLLGYNLFTSDDLGAGTGSFMVPWHIIIVFTVGTLAVAMLTTWIPSRQASRIAPAEALRYE